MSQAVSVPGVTPLVGAAVRRPAARDTDLLDYVLAAIVAPFVVLGFVAYERDVVHTLIFPVTLCGVLLGADAFAWLRGKFDTFDPKGLIGVFGVHFFFIAPLLQVATHSGTPYVKQPTDWRTWLALMGWLNLLGLLIYKAVQHWAQRGTKRFRTVWVPVRGRTGVLLSVSIFLSVAAAAYVVIRLGGLTGMAEAFTGDTTQLYRLGIPRMMSHALPLLCFFALTVFFRGGKRKSAGWTLILCMLVFFAVMQLIVAGASTVRGLASTAVLWILIGVHYFWRPIRVRALLWLMIPLVVFLWFYGFYKSLGLKAFALWEAGATVEELAHKSQRPFYAMFLGDFGRADVHAYIAYILVAQPQRYTLRWGETYLTSVIPMIPFWIWPGKPADSGKVVAGTELMYGKGFYKPFTMRKSKHAYGLTGEAMLNFGLPAVLPAFALWGFLVGRLRRYIRGIVPGDLRLLMVPYLIYFLGPNLLLWDSDNYIAHTFERAGFALLVLFMMVGRQPRQAPD